MHAGDDAARAARARENRARAIVTRTTRLVSSAIAVERVRALNARSINARGAIVVYWMQASHRVRRNEALEYAVHRANVGGKPLVVMFSCTAGYPDASERHYGFMFEGLLEASRDLTRRGIAFRATIGSPPASIIAVSRCATEIIVDCAYMRLLRSWRDELAREASCLVTEVECDVVVPQMSSRGAEARAEIAAATFRPKVLPRVAMFVKHELPEFPYAYGALDADTRRVFEDAIRDFETLPVDEGVDACLSALDAHGLERLERCPRVTSHVGGERAAYEKLDKFLTKKMLSRYAQSRNDPSMGLQSHLSPHIQYGQISVIEIARRALEFQKAHREDKNISASVDVFLDELIVRRELAVNFALRNPNYDTYEGLPEWSRNTLERHANDKRVWTYTLEQFERGETHDKLWNASQRELVVTGKQHNFLRMYWGKKILEWTARPEEAWRIAMTLNNRYSLDGRNMVSLTGVGWCFGLHDREFHDVEITGTTRRFSAEGMSKKFPAGMKEYLNRWGAGGDRKRQVRIADMFKPVEKRPRP